MARSLQPTGLQCARDAQGTPTLQVLQPWWQCMFHTSRQRDPRSDETLVRACNQGDRRAAAAAFEALYLRHKDYVLRVALRFTSDIDTALDVLQDTFVQLLRRFPPAGDGITLTAKLTTLLYPIAKNSAISAERKAGRFPAADNLTPDDLAARPARQDDDIGRLLAVLPSGQREAITLRIPAGWALLAPQSGRHYDAPH